MARDIVDVMYFVILVVNVTTVVWNNYHDT